MSATSSQVRTIVHAIELVVAVHRAKLSDGTRMAAEKIARTAGASTEQLQRAVARGLQASFLLSVFALGCRPVNAALTGTSDSVVTIPASTRIPGRFAGMSQGAEVWDMGDFTVRVRRVQP